MDTFTRMIRKNFPIDEHRFLYWDRLGGNDRALLEYGNSVEIVGSRTHRIKQLIEEIDKADVVIWHGLMFGARRALLPLLYSRCMKKSVWIMRGIDLYNWKKHGNSIKARICNRINYLCRKQMPYVGYIFPTDEEVYYNQFGKGAGVFYLPYPIAESAFDLMEKYRNCEPRSSGKHYIQVAHNAYAFNRHLEILKRLEHFREENVRVIVPLSYGNDWDNGSSNYYQLVSSEAKKVFGEKAVCLKRLMPPQDYSELLCNVDISVYGAARQNGLGNILRSLYMGNKVYLSEQSPLYDYLSSYGIDIGKTESIENLTFEEFCKPASSEEAVELIRRNHYPDACACYWGKVFDFFKTGRVGDSDCEKEIDEALAKVFPWKGERIKQKSNYINLDRYVEQPRKTIYAEMQDVLILGAGNIAIRVYEELQRINKAGRKWSIAGFLDYKKPAIGEKGCSCDIIGTPKDVANAIGMKCINAFEDAQERRIAMDDLKDAGAQMITFAEEVAEISLHAGIGEGCLFLGACRVSPGAIVKDGTLIKDSSIESSAHIGEYCTLQQGCWIGEGAVVGDEVVIGAFSKIAPGVRIGAGSYIQPFSTVDTDVI